MRNAAARVKNGIAMPRRRLEQTPSRPLCGKRREEIGEKLCRGEAARQP